MTQQETQSEPIDPLWCLVDPLTVRQAAALVAGADPTLVRFDANGDPSHFENDSGLTDSQGMLSVRIAFAALVNSINAGLLKATIRRSAWTRGWDEEPETNER